MNDLFCKPVELHHFRDIQALTLPKFYQFFSVTAHIGVFPLALAAGGNSVRLLKIGTPFLGVLGALCRHLLSPALIMILQGVHHLRRGLVELFGFIFGRASLHAVSVA